MSDTTYDLFKGNSQENAMWIEAVEGLEAATERMNRLASKECSDYFLFQSGNVIASVQNSKTPSQANQQPRRTIILSPNRNRSASLSGVLKAQEIDPICAATVKQYRDILSKQALDLVFCDPKLPDGDYKDVINATRMAGSLARIVVTSRLASWPEFLEAMRVGAFDVISSPCRYKDVEWVMMQAARDDGKRSRQLMTADEGVRVRRATAAKIGRLMIEVN